MWIKDFVTEQDNPLRMPPFVIITHLFYNDVLPAWKYPLHSHEDEFEVGFIMKGEGTFTVDERDTAIRAGDICVIPPGTYHFFSGEGMEYFTMRFDADPVTGTLQSFFREKKSLHHSGRRLLLLFCRHLPSSAGAPHEQRRLCG